MADQTAPPPISSKTFTQTAITPKSEILHTGVGNVKDDSQPSATPLGHEPRLYIYANIVRILLKSVMAIFLWYRFPETFWLLVSLFILTEACEWIVAWAYKKNTISTHFAAGASSALGMISIHPFVAIVGITMPVWYILYFVHMTSALSRFYMTGALFAMAFAIVSYVVIALFQPVTLETALFLFFLLLIGFRMVDFGRFVDDLIAQKQKVLELDKMKNDFIAIISHNLRTPIGAIKGYVELLLRPDTGTLTQDQAQMVNMVAANNKRLEEVVEEIIGLSIIESKTYNVVKGIENYYQVVLEVVTECKPLAEQKGISLVYSVAPSIAQLTFDRRKIKLVLANLVDNAIKFTEKGEVKITVTKEHDMVVTKVADTGIGIPKEQIAHLFEKFHRVGNVMVYDFKGAGLGLYTCKTIIDLHGGTITADSQEGKGTTITFTLPLPQEA